MSASATNSSTPLQRHYAEPINSQADGAALPAGVQFAAAAERNKADIGAALQAQLAAADFGPVRRLLELSSGTGQHVAHFASLLPAITFQPSDQSADAFDSIKYHSRNCANVLPPLIIDLLHDESAWKFERHSFDALFVANMLHISAAGTTAGLFRAAQAALRPGGRLFVYGPFKRDGQFTTDSNQQFDAKLRQMNPAFGLRDIADVSAAGANFSFRLLSANDMPANNFLLTFVKESGSAQNAAL